MTEIVIQGIGGRMGHVLCDMIAQREDCCVVAGIDMKDGEQNGIPVYDSLEKLNGKGDVIIDFSSPAAVEKALPYCQTHKLPIVVCTTGLSEELQLKVVQLSRSVPVFKSANMSMGINVLAELCKRASAVLKLWGHIEGDQIVNAEKPVITAQCFRVPVSDGHTAAVFVSFDKKPTKEQMLEAWANFRGPAQELNLPSAPKQFLHYFTEPDRPQPKLDRNTENGMAVCIGRLREDTLFDYKFACMSHNTLRGAAGGAVLLAELLAAKGYMD